MAQAICPLGCQWLQQRVTPSLIGAALFTTAGIVSSIAGNLFLAMRLIGGAVGLVVIWAVSRLMHKAPSMLVENPVQRAQRQVQAAIQAQIIPYQRINAAIVALRNELERPGHPLTPRQLHDMEGNLLEAICGDRVLMRDRQKYLGDIEQMLGPILLNKAREYVDFSQWIVWAGERGDAPWYHICHRLHTLITVADANTAQERWAELFSSPPPIVAIPLLVKNALAEALPQIQARHLQLVNFRWRPFFQRWNAWAGSLGLPTFQFPQCDFMTLQAPIAARYQAFLRCQSPQTFILLMETCIHQFDGLSLENIAPQDRSVWAYWQQRLSGLDASQINPPLLVHAHNALLSKINIMLYRVFDADPMVLLMDTAQDGLQAQALGFFLSQCSPGRNLDEVVNATWVWLETQPGAPTLEEFIQRWTPHLMAEARRQYNGS